MLRPEHLRLPPELDYDQVQALGFEVRQKLNRHRPGNPGAGRTSVREVTPAAISLLLVHLKKRRFPGFNPAASVAEVQGD